MAKLIIKLEQHTPIIHFQAEQHGATLRATELKPKLDKFLIKTAFNNDFELYKKYLIGYTDGKQEADYRDKKPFDYKVRVGELAGWKSEEIIKGKMRTFPNYFGNLGNDDASKFAYCNTLDLEIFAFNKELLDQIARQLPEFFMHHNFGKRQSKGFGSFFINSEYKYYINSKEFTYTNEQIASAKNMKYRFVINIDKSNARYKYDLYKQVFEKIDTFYKTLRSGTTKSEPYIKLYCNSKNISWDKYAIRAKFNNRDSIDTNSTYLMKDLFGLSSNENWRTQDWNITKKHIPKSDKDIEIARFQSPIFFKPIRVNNCTYDVYFKTTEIDSNILGQSFLIKNGKGNEIILKTPDSFSFDEFFEFVMQNPDVYPKLSSIIKDIKNYVQGR